jgi:hypothetical protein
VVEAVVRTVVALAPSASNTCGRRTSADFGSQVEIGEPERTFTVEPLEDPVPRELPEPTEPPPAEEPLEPERADAR